MSKTKWNQQDTQNSAQVCGTDKPAMPQLIEFLHEHPELITARFIGRISDQDIELISTEVRAIKRLASAIGYPKTKKLLLRSRHLKDLKRATTRLQAEVSDVMVNELQKLDLTVYPSAILNHYLDDRDADNAQCFWHDSYPDSPILCNDSIKILHNYQELFLEAHTQHNCLADYHYDLTFGTCFAYQVLAPERASLTLCIDLKTKCLCIDDLCLKDNQPVSKETRKAVLKWLHIGNKWLKRQQELNSENNN